MGPSQEEAMRVGEWMRLPRRGRDAIFGLTRPWYYQAIKAGVIRSACLRRRGALTGVRLVNVASVREYIEKHTEGEEIPKLELGGENHGSGGRVATQKPKTNQTGLEGLL